jgi:chromosome segregation ATPase
MATQPQIPTKEEEGQPLKPPEAVDEIPTEQESIDELRGQIESKERRMVEMESGVNKLIERNKLLESKLEDLSSSEAPSEEKLAKEIPDWEMLSPVEQKLIKDQMSLNKEVTQLRGTLAEAVDKLNWEDGFSEVAKLLPNLRRRKVEFKEYCDKPENLKTPIEVLAKSFLFDEAQEMGAKKEKEILNRQGLERATGGEKATAQPTSKEITPEEAGNIRLTDQKRYMEQIRKGRFPEIQKPTE